MATCFYVRLSNPVPPVAAGVGLKVGPGEPEQNIHIAIS